MEPPAGRVRVSGAGGSGKVGAVCVRRYRGLGLLDASIAVQETCAFLIRKTAKILWADASPRPITWA